MANAVRNGGKMLALLAAGMFFSVGLSAKGAAQPSGNVALTPADGETIAGGAFPGGTIEVASGTVTLAASSDLITLGENMPASLTDGTLAFWVDANKNCITDQSGAVVQWADVREDFGGAEPTSDHAFTYKRGIVYQPAEGSSDVGGTAPTFKTDARFPGKKFLDFGDYGSGRWMYLADKDEKILHQRVRSFYCVIGFDTADNSGHILSDVEALNTKGKGLAFFHKASGGSAAGNISASSADSCLYNGETRLDGERIDPTKTHYKYDNFQVFGQVGPYQAKKNNVATNAYFSTLFNDRNNSFSGGCGYRHGGGVLGELLVWNRVLSEDERRQVEAYLQAKWFGKVTGGVAEIAANAKLMVATGDTDAALDSVKGEGTLVKNGEGTLTLDRSAALDAAKLEITEGAVKLNGNQTGAYVVPVVGTKLTVDGSTITAVSATKQNEAEIAGGAVRALPEDVAGKQIKLTEAELTLAPRYVAAAASERNVSELYPNLLKNTSFEDGKNSDWTWATNSGVDKYGNAWFGTKSDKVTTVPNTIPDGEKFAYIQSKDGTSSAITQSFTAPVTGLYRISIYTCRRTSRSEQPGQTIAQMYINDVLFFAAPVTADYRGDIDTFKEYGAVLPPLEKGETYTLRITVDPDNCTTDRALLIDQITLCPVAEGEYINIPNSDFASTTDFGSGSQSNGYKAPPVGTMWDLVSGTWGIARGQNTYSTDTTGSDRLAEYSKIYLTKESAISTTITVPRDGRVCFSMNYANRRDKNDTDARPTGQTLTAYLDSTKLVGVNPETGRETRTAYGYFDITAGKHTLKLQNTVNGSSADLTSLVDELRLVYVDEVSVAAENDGYYQITAELAGKALQLTTVDGVYNNFKYYPAMAQVKVGDKVVGKALMQDDTFRKYAYSTYLTKGEYKLTADCLASESAAQAGIRVASIAMLPIEASELADKETVKDVTLVLDGKSVLNLDYVGTMRVLGLKVDGRIYKGVVNAETLPGVITGTGALDVVPKGMTITIR